MVIVQQRIKGKLTGLFFQQICNLLFNNNGTMRQAVEITCQIFMLSSFNEKSDVIEGLESNKQSVAATVNANEHNGFTENISSIGNEVFYHIWSIRSDEHCVTHS